MKPPFLGTKIIDGINLHDLTGLINREILFASRWQFRKNQSPEEWEKFKHETVIPILDRLITWCEARKTFEPKMVYGYFGCKKQENALLVTSAGQSPRIFRFEFPRQRQTPNLCISDFFPDGFVTIQLVTIGNKVVLEGARLFNEKKYSEAFYLKGLAAELAEATAEYGNRMVCKELGVPDGQGARFSLGYPSAPSLMDQEKIYALLGGGRIGVKLTETYHLIPEYSTSAIISISPEAKHFRP